MVELFAERRICNPLAFFMHHADCDYALFSALRVEFQNRMSSLTSLESISSRWFSAGL